MVDQTREVAQRAEEDTSLPAEPRPAATANPDAVAEDVVEEASEVTVAEDAEDAATEAVVVTALLPHRLEAILRTDP